MILPILKKHIPATLWRFALVGVGGLCVDIAVLYAGLWGLGLSWFWAKVTSFLFAATFTWWLNRKYTFAKSNKTLLHEWASFLATNAFGGLINFLVYSAIMTQFPPHILLPAVATGMGSLSGLFLNYLLSKHLVFNQVSKLEITARNSSIGEIPPYPRSLYLVTALVCMAFGGLALWLGMDSTSVPNEQQVGQLTGFSTSWLVIALAWMASWLPAPGMAFIMGMIHGLNFLPLSAIVWQLCTLSNLRHRRYCVVVLALVGLIGAGGIAELYLGLYDNALSLGILTSILLVLIHWDTITQASRNQSLAWTILAGIPIGLVVGLKPPLAIFWLGLTVGFFAVNLNVPSRIRAAFGYGLGGIVGFGVGGGFSIVNSSWAALVLPFATQCVPLGLLNKVLFVFQFSFNNCLSHETVFRDFRIFSLIMLTLVAAVTRFWHKQSHPFTHPGPTLWLLAACMVTYIAWVPFLSIYDYLVPLEMLAPVLSVAAMGLLPFGKRTRMGAAISLLIFLSISSYPALIPIH